MLGNGLLERIVRGKRDERVYICEQEFAAFAMYYFAEFFTYKIPGFHWLMYKALNAFSRGKFKFLLWVMFRESAKTTIAKIFVVWCIVYRRKRFINWDSYDKGNAESALFDIATWIQTNKRIISDFGQLYQEDPRAMAQHKTMKRVNEFITSNRVKVKAYSTQESTRGRIFDRFRPDLYVVEDFETVKTIRSAPVTSAIMKHIDELKAGLSVDGQVLFLANLISDSGSVAALMAEAKENTDSWRMQQVAVEEDGKPTWPAKYVSTDEEAAAANKGRAPKERVVSLESLRRDLNSGGRKVFEAEMMNNPEAIDEPFFDRAKVDAQIAKRKGIVPLERISGFRVWEKYNPKARYAIGADTAKGVHRDSCTSAAIRFTDVSTSPSVLMGAYASNEIAPDLFAYELKAQGEKLGQCLVAPELNNTGYATVTTLKRIYPTGKIFRQRKPEDLGNKVTPHYGWEAKTNNVSTIYYALRSAFDGGELEVLDMAVLMEMRSFTRRDLEEGVRRTESPQLLEGVATTRHFDLLRAAAIAWDMREHAKPADKTKPYKQGAFEARSEYQGQ